MTSNTRSQGQSLPVHRNDETSRLLAGPQDEKQPSFSLTFSAIQLLRIPIIPIAIADIVLMTNCGGDVALGVLLECIPVGLCLWTAFTGLGAPGVRGNNDLEVTVGDHVLFSGRKSQDIGAIPQRKTRPYWIILGDFLATLLLTLLAVLSLASQIFLWDVHWIIFPLTLTLAILQLALTVLNFFSILRKAKITLHMAENDQNIKSAIPQAYTDEEPEAEQSV